MSEVAIHGMLALSFFVAAFLGIFVFYGSNFFWFKWIKKMESTLGAPGTGIGHWRYGMNDFFTRQQRVIHVFLYFAFLKLPVVGQKWASRVGHEITPLSKRDRRIGLALTYTFWLSALYCAVVAFTLMKVAPL